jgi:hypothetical protein
MFALDAGIFGSVEDLRKVALQALNEVIDQALNDPGFIDTLKRTTSAAAGAASASSIAVSKPKQESKQNTTEFVKVGILPPAFFNRTLPSNAEKELDIYS